MSEAEKISIVVPIYNVEEYLKRCVDSILAQTYRNIEVLLVDDGSPDNCGAICDEYAKIDERIIVHHIPNEGVAHARQFGVEASSGDYILFVDPDDWLPLDAAVVLYAYMRDDLDIVFGRDNRILPNKIKVRNFREMELDNEQYIRIVASYRNIAAPWGKLYRRKLFTENSFPNFKHTQDWLMNLDLAFRARKVKFVNDKVYNYFMRPSSTSISYRDTFEYEISFVSKAKSIIEQNGLFDRYKEEYAIGSLRHMRSMIRSTATFDRSHPIIIELSNILRNSKSITFKERLFAWALSSQAVHSYLHTKSQIKDKIRSFSAK